MNQISRLGLLYLILALLIMACEEEVPKEKKDPPDPIPQGTVIISETMESEALGRTMHYAIYLPPGYDTTYYQYPVLYLLHGMWGTYMDWVNNGMELVANYTIHRDDAVEMVIVMPDGLDAFYCNNYNDGDLLYEDFFIDEFIPHIESTYRIISLGNNRAIAGLSMGGYGTTFHAFKRPEMFCCAYSMSGAMDMGTSAPDLRAIVEGWSEQDLQNLPDYTMECGTDDFLVFASNLSFHDFLTDMEIEHTYIERPGNHDWDFWMACLPKALKTASENFEITK